MSYKTAYFFIGILLLSNIFTPVNALADQGLVDRKGYVSTIYEGFFGLIYMLSGSTHFNQGLTPVEKEQFEMLGKKIMPKITRLGPVNTQQQNSTSYNVPFTLKFSDKTEDFILKPGEPPRTAKFTDGIWMNLQVINKIEIGIPELFQLFFHEFGHLLEDKKNQSAIDSIAAKIAHEAKLYSRVTTDERGGRFISFTPPQVLFDSEGTIDYQPRPLLFIQYKQKVYEIETSIKSYIPWALGFLDQNEAAGHVYTRLEIQPKISTNQNASELLIDWKVNSQSLYLEPGVNYIKLFSDIGSLRSSMLANPIYNSYRVLQKVVMNQETGKLVLKDKARVSTFYQTADNQAWHEPLHIVKAEDDKYHIEGVIGSKADIKSVSINLNTNNFFNYYAGNVDPLTKDIFKVSFVVSRVAAEEQIARIDSIVVNNNLKWDLDKEIQLPLIKRKNQPAAIHPSDWEIGLFDKWVSISTINDPLIESKEVKMRFKIKNTNEPIDHIFIEWRKVSDIKNQQYVSSMVSTQLGELIPKDKLKQIVSGKDLIVEFVSKVNDLQSSDIKILKNNLSVDVESSMFSIINLSIISSDFQIVETGTRLTNSGWRSIFKIPTTKNNFQKLRCNQLFVL